MRSLIQRLSVLISVCLIALFAICLSNNHGASNNVDVPVRNVELVDNNLDTNSYFEKFDSYKLNFSDDKVNFTGYDSIKLSELFELDLISNKTIDNEVITKYSCTYDYENGIVSLSVSLIDGEEVSLIDTIYGVIIMDEDLKFDVAFDCDGEILLLSEMEEAGMLDDCGFFSKLKKVWNTTAGKIGTIATVATCAVVGTVCAVVPGGQLVTAVCIGAAVGAIGGTITAGIATYLEDGYIDWEAIACYATAGAVVGAVTSGISYGVSCMVKHITSGNTIKYGDKFGKLGEYTKNPKISINWSQTTNHATSRMAERGLSQNTVSNIVKNGKAFLQPGNKYLLVTKEGAAVVDSTGKLITAYSSAYFDETMLTLLRLLGL